MTISINKFFTNLIIIPFIFFGLSSFLFTNRVNLGATNVFELLVFVYPISLFIYYKKIKQFNGFYIFAITSIYVLFSYIYIVIYNNVHINDFLLAYKSFIYLIFLTFIINIKVFDEKTMLKFIDIIYIIFFAKYFFVKILGYSNRPEIFTENNFELMLVCSLYLIRFLLTKKHQLTFLFFLGCIIILSSSRSAILMYSVICLFVVNEKAQKYKIIFLLLGTAFVASLVLYLFFSRGETIENIDRYKFLQVFLYETHSWDIFQYMIGAPRLTQLSNSSCMELSFFEALMSFSGNGSCYSVILHSYLLRVIFDHGVIGLFFFLFFLYKILIMSNINKKIIWVIIAIFILNGLSVSSFNSVFFPISMIFLIGTKYEKHNLAG
jgi:hypothetical protein